MVLNSCVMKQRIGGEQMRQTFCIGVEQVCQTLCIGVEQMCQTLCICVEQVCQTLCIGAEQTPCKFAKHYYPPARGSKHIKQYELINI